MNLVNINLTLDNGLKSLRRGIITDREKGNAVPTKMVALSDSGDIAASLGLNH